MTQRFSYSGEKEYYAGAQVPAAEPYLHIEPYLSCWLDGAAVFQGKRVLDMGAGGCVYSRLILKRFAPRSIVTMDLLPERMLPALSSEPALQAAGGDCYHLPFRDGAFDVVFASLVLHRLPGLESIAGEVRRVLDEGGLYVGVEPNSCHLVNLYRHFLHARSYRSSNVYLLWPGLLSRGFEARGFQVQITFFYARRPSLRSRFLGPTMGILARKK